MVSPSRKGGRDGKNDSAGRQNDAAEQLTDHFGEILGRPVELRELVRLDTESLLFAPPAMIDGNALAYEAA